METTTKERRTMTFNQQLIQGLWNSRNRESDTPEQRENLRTWLRQCIRRERSRNR